LDSERRGEFEVSRHQQYRLGEYVETITEPSYCSQMRVLTYLLVGKCEVPKRRRPGILNGPYEWSGISVQGLVVPDHVEV